MILAIVVLGGMGSQLGVVLAAVVLVGLPELVRAFAELPHAAVRRGDGADHVWRPRGLLAQRAPTRACSAARDGGAR